jgi:hypothetical protein
VETETKWIDKQQSFRFLLLPFHEIPMERARVVRLGNFGANNERGIGSVKRRFLNHETWASTGKGL